MAHSNQCPQCHAENLPSASYCNQCKMYIGDLGTYRLLGLLAEGGFGAVYRGENKRTGYQVAVKLLRTHLGDSTEMQKRFHREASILQKMRHPHVVNVFDTGTLPGLGSYMVMEWLEGETLAQYVLRQEARSLTPAQALPLFCQLLEGLAHVHSSGVIHRDLKPQNIMLLTEQGQLLLKILDFGVAQLKSGEQLTQTGKVLGTPDFMAPEQISEDMGDICPQTDLYAVGLLLAWTLTGKMVFSGDTLHEILYQKLLGSPTSLEELSGHPFPLALEGLLQKVLQKQPTDRHPDAMSMLDALQRAIPNAMPSHNSGTHVRIGEPPGMGTQALDDLGTSPTMGPATQDAFSRPLAASPPQGIRPIISVAASLSLQPPGAGYHPQWYIPRPKEEELTLTHLASPGSPVVLWGPELLGKTWMLKYVADMLKEQDNRVVELSLKRLDESSLSSLDNLTQELALHISDELDAPDEWFEKAWKRPGNPLRKLTWFMGRKVLPAEDKPLVLILDRVDEVQKQSFSDDFFGMLRSWAEDASRAAWSNLRLLMAVSTTPTLLTERPNQSPFNLTPPVYLGDFGLEQLQELAARYQLTWDDQALQSILHSVGGHPYLVRLIMYHATANSETLENLLNPQHEVYQPYLNRYRSRVQGQPGWAEAIQQLAGASSSTLTPELYHSLYKAGLVTSTPQGEHKLRYSLYKQLLK